MVVKSPGKSRNLKKSLEKPRMSILMIIFLKNPGNDLELLGTVSMPGKT